MSRLKRRSEEQFPAMTVPPSQTAYGRFLNDPRFPSDGTLPDELKMFQPRVAFAWDVANNGKSVLRASWGVFNARQNMLTQVGSITTNGVQQQTIFLNSDIIASGVPGPTWPNVVSPAPLPPGQFPLFTGVRVFSKDYRNPRIYSTNVQFEQQIAPDTALYLDFTHSKGVYLTRFLNANQNGTFSPQLGEVAVTSALGKSLYRGFTVGVRKRFSRGFQFEGNYVLSKDLDDDSNERDPFSFRYADINNLWKDYALSDRDIRHKFNFVLNGELPWGILGNTRIQARSAQPISSVSPRTPTNFIRNDKRKNNEYFSLDWSLAKRFRFGGDRFAIVPTVEMFNTFNNDNLVNPLTTVALFNFDGFLRQGVGDPRQVQLSIRVTF